MGLCNLNWVPSGGDREETSLVAHYVRQTLIDLPSQTVKANGKKKKGKK